MEDCLSTNLQDLSSSWILDLIVTLSDCVKNSKTLLDTIISVPHGSSEYKAPPKIWLKMTSSTDKTFLNKRRNFTGVIANEQTMIDPCVGMPSYCNTGKWKHSLIQWVYYSQKGWTDQDSIIFQRWTMQQTINRLIQFTSFAGLGNKMKLKFQLQPFSLIHIQCERAFCFQFCNLPPSSKCCYILRVPLDI